MKLATTSRGVETNLESSSFQIGDPRKLFAILADKIYSDKPRAVIREYACNALDIHLRTKQTKPFLISLPSALDPSFSVRDFGTGLRDELIRTLFCTFFASDKTDSNAELGGFGLGSKAGFAYTDAFTVTSFQAGHASVYAAFRGDDGIPQISLVGVSETDEPDGLEVKIPVLRADYATFTSTAQDILRWFPANSFTLFGATVAPVKVNVRTETYIEVPVHPNHWQRKNFVLMGPVAYEVDWVKMDVQLPTSIVPIFQVGDLDLPPSRETLSYDPSTIRALKARYDEIMIELPERALAAAETMTAEERIRFKDNLSSGGLSELFNGYHKEKGHRAADAALSEAHKLKHGNHSLAPNIWGTFLKREHEKLEIKGEITTYHKNTGHRSPRAIEAKAKEYFDLEFTYGAQFDVKRAFFLMDVEGKAPRTYSRLEDSGVVADRYHVVFDPAVLVVIKTHLPNAAYYNLSEFDAPAVVRTKSRSRSKHWVSIAGANSYYETHGELPDGGLYVPFTNVSPEGYAGEQTWGQLLNLPLVKMEEVYGLNVGCRDKVDMADFQRLDLWLKGVAKQHLQDPVVIQALAAHAIQHRVRNEHADLKRFVEARAAHGLHDLLPSLITLGEQLQADVKKVTPEVLTTLETLATWGWIKLPKVKDYHQVLPAFRRAEKRNPVLLYLISNQRDFTHEIMQRIVK